MNPDERIPETCRDARRTIQERLDGPVPVERDEALRDHLAGCDGCRQVLEGLETVRGALRALPPVPLPDRDLEAVWDRTVRRRSGGLRSWRAAAAAVILVAVSGAAAFILSSRRGTPTGPSPEEIALAERQVRTVFAITNRAFHQTERAAVREVLAGEISPALRRVPVRWPATPVAETRRNGT